MRNSKRSILLIAIGIAIPIILIAAICQIRQNHIEGRKAFIELRDDAATVAIGMSHKQVTDLLGVPDAESEWLNHLPNWRVYYFDIDRQNSLGRKPKSFVSVLIDSETGVKTVDIYDPVFETCDGNKIDETCTPINRKHHDRFAGPVIISG